MPGRSTKSLDVMPRIDHHLLSLALVVLTVLPSGAWAGITIHYEGRAKDEVAVDRTIALLKSQAQRNGWPVADASASDATLERIVNSKSVTYRGPVRGVVLRPNPNCEPFYVQFDSSHSMGNFVKTQFAGAEVHIKVIEVLKAIQPLLSELNVTDEGEYWGSSDRMRLQKELDTIASLIASAKRDNPKLKGPVTLPTGRIVDLMN